jgi:hypothetical protein
MFKEFLSTVGVSYYQQAIRKHDCIPIKRIENLFITLFISFYWTPLSKICSEGKKNVIEIILYFVDTQYNIMIVIT